jgi:streptogramin lyase
VDHTQEMRGALAVSAALAVALTGCGGCDDAPPEPSAPQVAELGSGAVGVADVGGEAWLVQPDAGTVLPDGGDPIDVGRAPLRIVSTPGGVWVSVIRDGTVVRIDPDTGEVDKTVRLDPRGSEPEGLAWDGTSLWVVDQAHGRVVRLGPGGALLGEVVTDDAPRLVAAGDSGVWVANYGGKSVSRIRGDRARTAALTGCVGPQGIAEAAGKVWVSCTLNGAVVVLDADTLEQVTEIPDVPDADAVVADGDTVYVVGQAGPTIWVVDAASDEVRDSIVLDDAPTTSENVGAAVVGADLVVTHPDVRKVYTMPLP